MHPVGSNSREQGVHALEEAVEARSAPAPRVYYPSLDALRFFAFLLVFFMHVTGFTAPGSFLRPLGAFGVPVFFLLSAYLITTLLLIEKDRTGTVHVGAFYLRRVLRIWPLYYLCLVLFLSLDRFLPFGRMVPHAVAAFACFLGNWSLLRHGWTDSPLDPLWTISVEEQFYMLAPVLARLASPRALGAICAAVMAVAYTVAFRVAPYYFPTDPPLWCNSFFHFQFFSAGMLIALVFRHRTIRFSPVGQLLLVAAALGFWVMSVAGSQHSTLESAASVGRWLLVLLGAMLLLIAALSVQQVPRWLAWLGKISYGLYLFHAFFLYLIYGRWMVRLAWLGGGRMVLGFVLTLAAAAFSYRFFETPFLRLKERFAFVASRPA